MSEETVLFGFYLHQNRYTLNNCILQAKYFIHKEMCKKNEVSFTIFLAFLKYKISVEQHILYSQAKQVLFDNRWSDILHKIV